MIYYYQIVSKPLAIKTLKEETCPVCNTKGSIQLTLYMRYISAGIPVFGTGRRTAVYCSTCNHTIKSPDAPIFAKKNYSENIAIEIENIRRNHKRTLWQLVYPWSLIFVLIGIIILGLISQEIEKHSTQQIKEQISTPKLNDLYLSSWDENGGELKSAIIKLVRMDGDTLFVTRSNELMQMTFDKNDWEKFTDKTTFGKTEYKLSKSTFIKNAEYFEFPDSNNNNQLTYRGSLLGKSSMNLSYDVIIRK